MWDMLYLQKFLFVRLMCSSVVVNDFRSSSLILVACHFHMILGLHSGVRDFILFRRVIFSRLVLIIVKLTLLRV